MYSDLDFLNGKRASSANFKTKKPSSPGLVALRLEFVAKPNDYTDLTLELAEVIQNARLASKGLEGSVLLVSDREARLVTVIGFWDCERFLATRERCIAWMQKLMTPYADRSIRAHTSLPAFVTGEVKETSPEPLADRTRALRKTDLAEMAAG